MSPEVTDGHVFHQYTVRVLNGRRDGLAERLSQQSIQTMVYYPVPVHRLPVYTEASRSLTVAERLSGEVISLPIWPAMCAGDQDRVLEVLVESIQAVRPGRLASGGELTQDAASQFKTGG